MSGLPELLERLVAIESVNPILVPGGAGEAELGRFVAAWLEERGVEVAVRGARSRAGERDGARARLRAEGAPSC